MEQNSKVGRYPFVNLINLIMVEEFCRAPRNNSVLLNVDGGRWMWCVQYETNALFFINSAMALKEIVISTSEIFKLVCFRWYLPHSRAAACMLTFHQPKYPPLQIFTTDVVCT